MHVNDAAGSGSGSKPVAGANGKKRPRILVISQTFVPDPASVGQHMADVAKEVPGIIIDLRYATADNFFRKKFYTDARALLCPATARKLAARRR